MGGDKSSGGSRTTRKKIEIDDEKLIECVQRHPSLYELNHIEYGNGVSRKNTWKAIGAELKIHPLFCKKRWGNIRDNYKKAMKKYNSRLSQGHTKLKKYKFSDKLYFLQNELEYVTDNNDDNYEYNGNNDEDKSEQGIDIEYDDLSFHDVLNRKQTYVTQPMIGTHFEINHIEENITTDCENISQTDTRVSELDDEERNHVGVDNNLNRKGNADVEEVRVEKQPSSKTLTITNPSHLRLKRKRKLNEPNCKLNKSKSKSMRYILERVEEDKSAEKHPVDAFLAGIAPTLKNLSAYYLSLAKTQIYSVVQEYEMAMIIEQRNESLGF